MVDIHSLMRALPVYGLEPQTLAYIQGFPRPKMNEETYVSDSIGFLEPPAGQHEPYVEPIGFMQRIFVYHGMNANDSFNLKRHWTQASVTNGKKSTSVKNTR